MTTEELAKIRTENPFCDAAPEIFGAMTLEDARKKYPHFFRAEDDWRLKDLGKFQEEIREFD